MIEAVIEAESPLRTNILAHEPDPPRDIARLLGVERLAAVSRARLDEAIARASQHSASSRPTG